MAVGIVSCQCSRQRHQELHRNSELHCFDLYDIEAAVEGRPPVIEELIAFIIPIAEFLKQRADSLRHHAQPMLEGYFTLVPLIEERVKARARKFAIAKWGPRANEFGW